MESINTINKTLFGAALAVLALAMAIPQGAALARGGMELRTADLCLVTNGLDEWPEGIGTVAAVTDNRLGITAWAVSLEELSGNTYYGVYSDATGNECEGDSVYWATMKTYSDGNAYRNSAGPRPEVGYTVWICRLYPAAHFDPTKVTRADLTAILKGVLVKGGKEKNKPGRCPE